jgi:hypothetical protein
MAAGWPEWPWHLDAHHGDESSWYWWSLAIAGVAGAAYESKLLPKAMLLVVEIALVALLPWLLTGHRRPGWSFEWCVVMLGSAWIILFTTWWVLRAASKAQPGMAVPLAGTIALVADAFVLYEYGDAIGWRLAGVGAVALGISVATTLWRRPFVCGTGGTLCITIAHAGVLWFHRAENETLRGSFVLALLAPLGMWVATTKAFADGRTTGMLVGVAVTAAIAGSAVAAA